ncbi:phage antirepressor KilAC domain-containing protein [Helcococcus kunzii]|uniref:phage antirepressor KilAC domain-containing protein n=1 Tax=Helcococcus kunzii TaxID=40091 RepID=UPI0024AD8286|nr:phage antirepressor KilAC domain-containing protein [Helcococcus kunzii]
MNELQIKQNENLEPVISGRQLHDFLEVGTAYDVWIKRMMEYGFIEEIDFSSFLMESTGGRPSTDHLLKIDMAKELSMIQRTEKGKQARQYFIQVEKEYNSPEKVMARALQIANRELSNLKIINNMQLQQIKELKPKADYTDRILKSKSLVLTSQIAKDYGMSAQQMNKHLSDLKIQYKANGQWLLYSKYHDKGYTSSETFEFTDRNGNVKTNMTTKWTQKGRLFLYNLLKENGILPTIEQENEQ